MSPALDSAPAHKPRNKLRKTPKLRPGSTVSNIASPRGSSDSPRHSNSSTTHGVRTPQSPRSTLPLPPDLSDSKWLEYIRQSGYLVPMEKSPRLESIQTPPNNNSLNSINNNSSSSSSNSSSGSSGSSGSSSNSNNNSASNIVAELAHLTPDVPVPAKSPRRSLERHIFTSDSPISPSSSTFRRQPKTPVLRVGQLDGRGEAERADKASSVELIAEQYRALLESRSTEELRQSALSSAREEGKQQHVAETRQASVDAIRGAILRRLPVQPSSPPPSVPTVLQAPTPEYEAEGSPTSDGTLVAFEEDAIYFKPVSFSPEALSPILEHDDPHSSASSYSIYNTAGTTTTTTTTTATATATATSTPPPAVPRPDVLSLQIAMDLLTQELSSAVSNESLRAPANVRCLQIWVMIEAYEKLRDQVLEMNAGMPMEEVRALMGMFNMWLRALYRVHDRLRDRGPSPSEIETLQMEELD